MLKALVAAAYNLVEDSPVASDIPVASVVVNSLAVVEIVAVTAQKLACQGISEDYLRGALSFLFCSALRRKKNKTTHPLPVLRRIGNKRLSYDRCFPY